MGSPYITYNSKTITFPSTSAWHAPTILYGGLIDLAGESASGVSETLIARSDVIVHVPFHFFLDNNNDAVFKRRIQQWYEWARTGGSWIVSMDNADETISTTLSAGLVNGDTIVTVTSRTGVVAGRNFVIRSDTRSSVVRVNSLGPASDQVTLLETIDYPFSNLDTFRSEKYWSGELLNRNINPIQQVGPSEWHLVLDFKEAR